MFKDIRGFTLVEILVVISLMTILFSMGYALMSNSSSFIIREIDSTDDRLEINALAGALKDAIRSAKVAEKHDQGILLDGKYYGISEGIYNLHGANLTSIKNLEFTEVNDRIVSFKIITESQEISYKVALLKTFLPLVDKNTPSASINSYSNVLKLSGDGRIFGPGHSVSFSEKVTMSNSELNHIETDNIYINGDLVLPNSVIGTGNGSVYVKGNVKISGSDGNKVRILGDLYLSGTLITDSYLDPNKMVSGAIHEGVNVEIPPSIMPEMESEIWYTKNGFKNNIDTSNTRYKGGGITLGTINENLEYYIVSTGNVNLNSWQHLHGIILAPNGKVLISGSGKFTGRIIANEIEVSGNSVFYIEERDLSLVGILE